MGVNVRCEVCGIFIRRVETRYVASIKEDEICDDCDKKIRTIYSDFEKSIAKFKKELGELNAKSIKDFKDANKDLNNLKKECDDKFKKMNHILNQTYENYINEMQCLMRVTKAELGDKIMKMGRFFK